MLLEGISMENQLPRRIDKPWGYELIFAVTPVYAGKLIFVRKGHRLSLQYHKNKDESLYIYQGRIRLELEDGDGRGECSVVESGCCLHIPPLTKHRLEAIEDATLFEVSTPELDDVERLADDYGRAD
jgi:mannose-6-phosphate isomerase-like protein (cupin superfamily)